MAALEAGAGRIKVPIDRVAAAAYRAVFGHLGRVLELSWLPLLVLLAAELVPGLVFDYLWPDLWPDAAADAPGAFNLPDLAESLIAMLCLSAFAVRWHGLMLALDRRALSRRRFLMAWARFIGYALPFYLIVSTVVAALAVSGGAEAATQDLASGLAAALALALSLLFARCSLVFPAAVFGQKLGIVAAWRRMRGNTWRLIAATLLVTAPVMLVAVVLVDVILVGARLPLPDVLSHPPLGLFLLDGVLDTVLAFLFVALGATVLAEFFRRIVLGANGNVRRG